MLPQVCKKAKIIIANINVIEIVIEPNTQVAINKNHSGPFPVFGFIINNPIK